MNPYLGNLVAIRCAAVYYLRSDPVFSADIKCRNCMCESTYLCVHNHTVRVAKHRNNVSHVDIYEMTCQLVIC